MVEEHAKAHGMDQYQIVLLLDDLDSIADYHSDRIYNSLSTDPTGKDILLIIQSRGGRIEPAYLISKTCKKMAQQKFVVAVPRKAKSAATLIALGADEIHLGMMSQLGPIDPQINNLPALGMANGLTKISQLASDFPKSADLWAKYLSENLSLSRLGYLERLGESLAQYAERLLANKKFPAGTTAKSLADHFVNHYKDHSFLIDIDEAINLLGSDVIKSGTSEYMFANEVYKEFTFLEFLISYFNKQEAFFVGGLSPHNLTLREKKAV